jgi:four helix bundle protein
MLDHEKLDVYAISLRLASLAFDISEQLAAGYGSLADQLRRAATSIAANIAEACGRNPGKDRRRFMAIARGSATETGALIDLCRLKVDVPQAPQVQELVLRVVQMLSKLSH